MNKKLQAHSAIFFANTIFGLGVPVTKLLLDEWVTPMGYMASRSLGACILFWIIAAFLPKEKVEKKDLITILAGGLLGFVISQTLTAWALDYTSPVYFSLIATLTPVAVMLCAALTIGEKITPMKSLGVLLGIAGAVLMVLMSQSLGSGKNDLIRHDMLFHQIQDQNIRHFLDDQTRLFKIIRFLEHLPGTYRIILGLV